jgi:chromosome segregation ATPase
MDLKELIDRIEERNKTRAQLEKRIDFLTEERKRLQITINEQKKIIEELKNKVPKGDEIPEDIQILKDLVKSQREELNDKVEQIMILKESIIELTDELQQRNQILSEKGDIQELEEKQNKIDELLEEKENTIAEIESIKSELETLKENDQQEKLLVELSTANNKIEKLEQEKKNLNSQIYYLQEELEKKIQTDDSQVQIADELSEAYNRIENLKQENRVLKVQIGELEEELDNVNEKLHTKVDHIELVENFKDQFEKEKQLLNEKIEHYEQLISDLEESVEYKENEIIDLKQKVQQLSDINQKKQIPLRTQVDEEKIEVLKSFSEQNIGNLQHLQSKGICAENLPEKYQRLLIERMFTIMNEYNKERFVDILIQDLYHDNPEIKRFAIKVLSKIKTSKVFNALIDLLDDKDWLVRFYLVKALGNFKDFEGMNNVMKAFINDPDVDVRKAAHKFLENN